MNGGTVACTLMARKLTLKWSVQKRPQPVAQGFSRCSSVQRLFQARTLRGAFIVQQMNNKAGLIGINAAIHNLTVLKTSKKLLRLLGPVVLVSLVGMPFIISEEKLG